MVSIIFFYSYADVKHFHFSDRCIKKSVKTPVHYNACNCKADVLNVFFFLLIVNVVLKANYFGNKYIPVSCSFWILQILLFRIFRGVQNYVTIYFSTSKQSFLWVDQLKSFCEFVSVRENSVKMFVFYPRESKHKQEFSTFTRKKIIIKIIWKILFSWNIICLRRFYLTMKISNFL